MKLAIILGSTREGRVTEKLAKWVNNEVVNQEGIESELIDLKNYNMPFFEEPISPRYNPSRQVTDTVKKWLEKIEKFDAYIVVTPEYNHSIPAVLKNALDTLDWQMKHKPASVVSHGTVGGARATMHLKEILSEVKALPIPTAVAFMGRVDELIDDNGKLSPEVANKEHGPSTVLENMVLELKEISDKLLNNE